ncbi:hypothetical protein [Nesterenkonia haasae]|uniref:hypothetical protein n=1 Tax=Nesterenkonia haasae TaxID=2587813 RepID=UPI001291C982|nr:hypothetical protein [Nesterenkonia haasae]NDK31294.1 hypothetical protein [Nesterenkonia haasae]
MSPFRRRRNTVITRPMARRRRRRRALVALGVTTAMVAGASYGTWRYIEEREFLLDERCAVTVGDTDYELSPTQTHNAALLAASAADHGLPPEAAVDALAMSMQETELNIRDSDDERGSEVLFARGAPDWTADNGAQPVEITVDGFFSVMERSWRSGLEAAEEADEDDEDENTELFWMPDLELDEAAAALERPHNPQFYPQHGTAARAFAWPLAGQTQGPDMTCHLSQLDVPGPDPEGVTDELVGLMPTVLEVPFTEPPEEDEEDEEFVPEPILDGIIEVSGQDEDALVTVEMPDSEAELNHQWLIAHWSVASAEDFGVQSVTSAPYRWERDSARWQRLSDEDADSASVGTVVLGFSRDH